jgi:hypothetical protein
MKEFCAIFILFAHEGRQSISIHLIWILVLYSDPLVSCFVQAYVFLMFKFDANYFINNLTRKLKRFFCSVLKFWKLEIWVYVEVDAIVVLVWVLKCIGYEMETGLLHWSKDVSSEHSSLSLFLKICVIHSLCFSRRSGLIEYWIQLYVWSSWFGCPLLLWMLLCLPARCPFSSVSCLLTSNNYCAPGVMIDTLLPIPNAESSAFWSFGIKARCVCAVQLCPDWPGKDCQFIELPDCLGAQFSRNSWLWGSAPRFGTIGTTLQEWWSSITFSIQI